VYVVLCGFIRIITCKEGRDMNTQQAFLCLVQPMFTINKNEKEKSCSGAGKESR
jgi:hypothetical protein